MKIRNGFVSNSSSSSFCILGFAVPEGHDGKKIEENSELDIAYGIEEYYEETFVGFFPEQMKGDETLNHFKQRIVDQLKTQNIDVTIEDICWYTDGGRDC